MTRWLLLSFAFLFSTQALALVKEDCEESDNSVFLTESEIKCTSCAIEKFTGRRPSEKYLAWVLFNAHQYYKDTELVTGETKKKLLKKYVIQQFQAYGYCDVNGYGHMPKTGPYAWSGLIKLMTPEKAIKNEDTLKNISKFFGYDNERTMQSIAFWKDWPMATPQQRQERFSKFIETGVVDNTRKPATFDKAGPNFYSGEFGDSLKACHQQIKGRYTAPNSPFNMQTGGPENVELCRLMAEDCGWDLAEKAEIDKLCGSKTISAPIPAGGGTNKTLKPVVPPSAPGGGKITPYKPGGGVN